MSNNSNNNIGLRGTTILCLKKGNDVVIVADGQVSLGNNIMKSTARKLRTLCNNKIIAGFAGSTADAFTLFERLETKLEKHYLRRLEAMLIVADKDNILIVSGNGDVIEPENNVAAIGSGGFFALSAARALMSIETKLSAEEIALKSMNIAADICVFSNHNIIIEKVI